MPAAALDVTYDDVVEAMVRIADGVVRTPCHESAALSELCGATIFSKAEYLQRTGSFKERGARNALLQLRHLGLRPIKQGAITVSCSSLHTQLALPRCFSCPQRRHLDRKSTRLNSSHSSVSRMPSSA